MQFTNLLDLCGRQSKSTTCFTNPTISSEIIHYGK